MWNRWKGVEFDVTPLNDHSDCHAMIFMKSSDLIGLPRPPIMGEEQIGAHKEQNREASKIPILDLEKIGCKQSCVLCARCYMQGSEEGDFRLTCTAVGRPRGTIGNLRGIGSSWTTRLFADEANLDVSADDFWQLDDEELRSLCQKFPPLKADCFAPLLNFGGDEHWTHLRTLRLVRPK